MTISFINSLMDCLTDIPTGYETSLPAALTSLVGIGTIVIGDVTGLQAALDAKSAIGHTHSIANVTSLQAALDAKAALSHTHIIADVTGLQTALDGKSATSHNHNLSALTDVTIASIANKQVPRWNTSTSKWENATIDILDTTGTIPANRVPAAAFPVITTVASQAAMIALSANVGDVAIRSDVTKTFILYQLPASTVGNWLEMLASSASSVTSVAGLSGVVTTNALKTALSINNVQNTADADKPISTLTQAALDAKQALHANLTGIASLSLIQGDLLTVGSGPAISRLGKGTGLQYLRMNAGATAQEWATLAIPSYTLVGSWTYSSNTAYVIFSGLDNLNDLILVGDSLKRTSGVDEVYVTMHVSPDAGATMRTSGYRGIGQTSDATLNSVTNGMTTGLRMRNDQSAYMLMSITNLFAVAKTSLKANTYDTGAYADSFGYYNTAESHNYFRLGLTSSYNWNAGTMLLYGK